MSRQVKHILQITDLHLFADIKADLLGVVTYESFKAVIKHASSTIQHLRPELIVLSGDLSQDDSEISYHHLMEAIAHFSQPIAWMPGNHDKPNMMFELFAKSHLTNDKHFLLDNWQIILLDSHWDDHVGGKLTAEQLYFLDTTLNLHSQHALIFLHHHVLPIQSAWIDNINLKNSMEFLAVIDKYPQVKGVICGHVHQDSSQIRRNIKFISAPSTCIQFKPLSQNFALDTQMPGYRSFTLYSDGSFETKLYRIDYDPQFLPDMQSKGY